MRNLNSKPSYDSATVAINSLAQQKKAAGIRVCNLSAGEPKIKAHLKVSLAAIRAIKQSKTLYPPVSGIGALKDLAAQWMNKVYRAKFSQKNTLVVNGGKFGLYLLMQFLLEKGDEVLIPSPYWVSYPAITELFKGKVKFLPTTEAGGWKITGGQILNAAGPKTKILVLNSACNPTGSLYSREELAEILKAAKQKKLLIISDEVYSGLVYDGEKFASCASFEEYRDRVVIIHSCSKNFAMTGWRIGFVFGPENLIKNLTTLISQSTSGVTTISQWAAVAALQNHEALTGYVQKIMNKRRNLMADMLKKILKINVKKPVSALYYFISLKDLGITNTSSVKFCEQALEKNNVAMVPGSAFGREGYIRLSFGAQEKEIIQGVKALAKAIKMCYNHKGKLLT